MNGNYFFGAGDFKLGDRVEVVTTGQRGILVCEIVHLSGCNTYQVLLPHVPSAYQKERMKMASYDYLLLRKLEPHEAVFGQTDDLTEDKIFSPKGTDVNAEWILSAVAENKEPIPEIDEGIGVEEIKIQPGMEVWHKVYNRKMLVYFVSRDIYSKELSYSLTYMVDDKEVSVNAFAYALIPLKQRINLYTAENDKVEKVGPVTLGERQEVNVKFAIEDFARYGSGRNLEQL